MYDKDNCVPLLTEQMQTEEGPTGEVFWFDGAFIYLKKIKKIKPHPYKDRRGQKVKNISFFFSCGPSVYSIFFKVAYY